MIELPNFPSLALVAGPFFWAVNMESPYFHFQAMFDHLAQDELLHIFLKSPYIIALDIEVVRDVALVQMIDEMDLMNGILEEFVEIPVGQQVIDHAYHRRGILRFPCKRA